jgi:hypothetical protein
VSDDPVIDYMIMEAVMIKAQQEDQKAQEEAERAAERKRWQKDHQTLKGELAQHTGQQ